MVSASNWRSTTGRGFHSHAAASLSCNDPGQVVHTSLLLLVLYSGQSGGDAMGLRRPTSRKLLALVAQYKAYRGIMTVA